jgi:hypothetical protein
MIATQLARTDPAGVADALTDERGREQPRADGELPLGPCNDPGAGTPLAVLRVRTTEDVKVARGSPSSHHLLHRPHQHHPRLKRKAHDRHNSIGCRSAGSISPP